MEVQRSPVYYTSAQPLPRTPSYQHGLLSQPQVQPRPAPLSNGHASHDHLIPSIEPQDDLRRKAIASASAQQHNRHRSRPASPPGSTGKRRRLDTDGHNGPPPSVQLQYTYPMDISHRLAEMYGGSPTCTDQTRPHSASLGSFYADSRRASSTRGAPLPNVAHDPYQPVVRINMDPNRAANGIPVTRSPIQYVPLPPQYGDQMRHLPLSRDRHYTQQPSNGAARPSTRVVYVDQPRAGYGMSQPQHGAPAAVQPAPVTVVPKYPPSAGYYAPQPQQYYYPG